MDEQKKYQGDNRVAKRNRKFYNSGVKIKPRHQDLPVRKVTALSEVKKTDDRRENEK